MPLLDWTVGKLRAKQETVIGAWLRELSVTHERSHCKCLTQTVQVRVHDPFSHSSSPRTKHRTLDFHRRKKGGTTAVQTTSSTTWQCISSYQRHFLIDLISKFIFCPYCIFPLVTTLCCLCLGKINIIFLPSAWIQFFHPSLFSVVVNHISCIFWLLCSFLSLTLLNFCGTYVKHCSSIELLLV